MPPHNNASNNHIDQNQNGKPPKEIMKLEPPTATVVVPPDGGWGWVVMIASFCSNVIVDGIVMSSSMFKESIEKEFGASKAAVSKNCQLCTKYH